MELPRLDLKRATEGLNSTQRSNNHCCWYPSHQLGNAAAALSTSNGAAQLLFQYFLYFAEICLPAFLTHQSYLAFCHHRTSLISHRIVNL